MNVYASMNVSGRNSTEDRHSLAASVSLAGLVLAGVLVVVGGLWSTLGQPRHVWSQEQAEELIEARNALHAATGVHDHGDRHAPGHARTAGSERRKGANYEEAKARFELLNGQLESARYAKHRGGQLLIRIGLVIGVCAGVGYMATAR